MRVGVVADRNRSFAAKLPKSTAVFCSHDLRAYHFAATRILKDDAAVSVGEVAKRCGFARQEHFWHAFKGRFGVSPSLYAAKGGK